MGLQQTEQFVIGRHLCSLVLIDFAHIFRHMSLIEVHTLELRF